MRIETDGLVIREQTVGESDRLVTLLTRSVRHFESACRELKIWRDVS